MEKIEDVIIKDEAILSDLRFKNLYVSEMAICGYKYRNAIDNNLRIPHKWSFEIGNAFEYIIVKKLKKIYPNGNTQYKLNGNDKYIPVKEDKDFVGHCDFVDVESSTVIEIKSSKSNNFNDIYYRQLFAYMLIGHFKNGILLKYNILQDKMYEFNYSYQDALANEVNFFDNINAFYSNTYVKGIENSICKFCENVKCPMNGVEI